MSPQPEVRAYIHIPIFAPRGLDCGLPLVSKCCPAVCRQSARSRIISRDKIDCAMADARWAMETKYRVPISPFRRILGIFHALRTRLASSALSRVSPVPHQPVPRKCALKRKVDSLSNQVFAPPRSRSASAMSCNRARRSMLHITKKQAEPCWLGIADQ